MIVHSLRLMLLARWCLIRPPVHIPDPEITMNRALDVVDGLGFVRGAGDLEAREGERGPMLPDELVYLLVEEIPVLLNTSRYPRPWGCPERQTGGGWRPPQAAR